MFKEYKKYFKEGKWNFDKYDYISCCPTCPPLGPGLRNLSFINPQNLLPRYCCNYRRDADVCNLTYSEFMRTCQNMSRDRYFYVNYMVSKIIYFVS